MGSFTIRVYGICIQDSQLLVVDEYIKDEFVTKLPGGGLEFGEGTRECLAREIKEEIGEEVEVLNHFYTTDYFQVSKFNPDKQVISIYYTFRFKNFSDTRELLVMENEKVIEAFRWIPVKDLKKENLSLPIDQLVVQMLHDQSSLREA